MSEQNSQNSSMVLAHVLFMDIVGYSKLPIEGQKEVSEKLKNIVLATKEVKSATAEDKLISLYTGDGMALCFLNNPIAPVECAIEISRKLRDFPEIELRMGIHSGIVEKIKDVNDQVNVAGGGINTAQRVMDCGDDGHILLSKRVAEDLSQYGKWQPFLHDLKETEVKHGVKIHIYNFYSDEFGNSEPPEKFKTQTQAKSSSNTFLIAALILGVLIIGGLAAVYFYQNNSAVEIADTKKTESEFVQILEQKQDDWIKLGLRSQAENGGIKDSPSAEESTAQVWTTTQVLTGIFTAKDTVKDNADKIKKAFEFIEEKRRTSPAEGWNLYGDSNEYTITEVNSWVTVSRIKSLPEEYKIWSDEEKGDVISKIARDLDDIVSRQESNGGFRPIKDENPAFTRTYSTILALWSLLEAKNEATVSKEIGSEYDANIDRSIKWLLENYQSGEGWQPNPNRNQTENFAGLTAHTLYVLSIAEKLDEFRYIKQNQNYLNAKKDFIGNEKLSIWKIDEGNSSVPSADLRFADTSFVPQGTNFLWFPWSLATLSNLSVDESLSDAERQKAQDLRLEILNNNAIKLTSYVETQNLNYILGENLIGVAEFLNSVKTKK